MIEDKDRDTDRLVDEVATNIINLEPEDDWDEIVGVGPMGEVS